MLNKSFNSLIFISLLASANVFAGNQVDDLPVNPRSSYLRKICDGFLNLGKYAWENHKLTGLSFIAIAALFKQNQRLAASFNEPLDTAQNYVIHAGNAATRASADARAARDAAERSANDSVNAFFCACVSSAATYAVKANNLALLSHQAYCATRDASSIEKAIYAAADAARFAEDAARFATNATRASNDARACSVGALLNTYREDAILFANDARTAANNAARFAADARAAAARAAAPASSDDARAAADAD